MPSSVYSNFFLLLRFDKRVSREWNIDSALMRQPEELVNSALENAAEAADSLPKSDLNPLINPVLGRNLGRWAQVYFTSPPEKREQAVVELLRELETGVVPVPHVSSSKKLEDGRAFCSRCQRQGEPGQRFCVICGSSL